ncbi:MAG: S-layer homology domain-containing protein [Cylindrospermopsis raciborskii KL1]|uniref:S-layer homology domain-containing protein n=1 Tax=Cylindrospermopsis raciborskii TaxID=77022 RepID=UPI001A33F2D9|nr:S-layer homology domain-containing protein [Cylindrospermopsis raciborskii]MBG0743958.1 S-layer homology domain-containing protein [Cylindrospermopsis raciborskii KL1]
MVTYKPSTTFVSIAVSLFTLTGCANAPIAKNWERNLAADPRLQEKSGLLSVPQQQQTPPTPVVSLPSDFPKVIPLYSNAELIEVERAENNSQDSTKLTVTRWESSDPSNMIAGFYASKLQTDNWQILQKPGSDGDGIFEAQKTNLLLKLTIKPTTITNTNANQPRSSTELTIEYQLTNNLNNGDLGATITSQPQPSPTITDSTNTSQQSTSQIDYNQNFHPLEFTDLPQVPLEWRKPIEDLGKLGVLSIDNKLVGNNQQTKNYSAQIKKLEPNKIIARREFARWLVTGNNVMYANKQAKKIRLPSPVSQPIFKDVPPTDVDFPFIQGLAEAGLIPSPLSGDATELLFRPDAPLTRENLLMWKVPLDTRQSLPNSSMEAVKQTWGFQDTAKIDLKALRAVLADFQNGEQSNIRRVFGYTTLFQPKKAVTRGEAALTISYFGSQGEGVSTTEALKLKSE